MIFFQLTWPSLHSLQKRRFLAGERRWSRYQKNKGSSYLQSVVSSPHFMGFPYGFPTSSTGVQPHFRSQRDDSPRSPLQNSGHLYTSSKSVKKLPHLWNHKPMYNHLKLLKGLNCGSSFQHVSTLWNQNHTSSSRAWAFLEHQGHPGDIWGHVHRNVPHMIRRK